MFKTNCNVSLNFSVISAIFGILFACFCKALDFFFPHKTRMDPLCFSPHCIQNRAVLFSKATVLPCPVGQRSCKKIINRPAGLTLGHLPLPLAIFRETRASLRSDVDVGRRAFALFGLQSAVAGQVDGKCSCVFGEMWHPVLVRDGHLVRFEEISDILQYVAWLFCEVHLVHALSVT